MESQNESGRPAGFFQEAMEHNHCFGCGQANGQGLQIRSRWDEDDPALAVCEFVPSPHHSAYPFDVLNGGIIAVVIDCHAVCSSIADAYRHEGREIGEGELIVFATGTLRVTYSAPTPLNGPVKLVGRVTDRGERRTTVEVTVLDQAGEPTATAEVVSVRVPAKWAGPAGVFSER